MRPIFSDRNWSGNIILTIDFEDCTKSDIKLLIYQNVNNSLTFPHVISVNLFNHYWSRISPGQKFATSLKSKREFNQRYEFTNVLSIDQIS